MRVVLSYLGVRAVRGALAAAALAVVLPTSAAATNDRALLRAAPAVPTSIFAGEWATFKRRFVRADGRVVDIEKSGKSHSESQSYGMLLAVKANDRATFDKILSFTFNEMRARNDHLVSWLYNPAASPPVADTNNASDGDIMIAYGLLKAGLKWDEPRYVALATPMIDDIGRLLLHRRDDMVLLRPGAFGFDERHHYDGPVVNLSYYIYGALLMFEAVNDRHPFLEAWQSGLMLTEEAVARSNGHAPDWITMRDDRALRPAEGFAKKSSYDAVRIPLFMALGGRVPPRYLAPFDRAWNLAGNGVPQDRDLATGRKLMDMNDLGYRAIAALTACAVRGVPIPARLQRYQNTTYFSSALHLLALSAAREHYPNCVGAPNPPAIIASDRPTPVLVGSTRPRDTLPTRATQVSQRGQATSVLY
ncbi:MAG: glycosyl hydrolase family 8 [Pseudomonadota bacterium]